MSFGQCDHTLGANWNRVCKPEQAPGRTEPREGPPMSFGVCNHDPSIKCGTCAPSPFERVHLNTWVVTGAAPAAPGDCDGCSMPHGRHWDTCPNRWVETDAVPVPGLVDHRRVAAKRAVDDLLRALGVPQDEHTANTPDRVARSFIEMLGGYDEDPAEHLERQFPGLPDSGMVVCSGIRFTSLCAHHLLPFSGTATVAYLPQPGSQIVGLSKLARVLEGYAHRLQTQEFLGAQVADALDARLNCAGAGCIITSAHACMGVRGVRQPDAVMTTSSLRGEFKTNDSTRAELLSLHQAEL